MTKVSLRVYGLLERGLAVRLPREEIDGDLLNPFDRDGALNIEERLGDGELR